MQIERPSCQTEFLHDNTSNPVWKEQTPQLLEFPGFLFDQQSKTHDTDRL
jgi:hypothetical protein